MRTIKITDKSLTAEALAQEAMREFGSPLHELTTESLFKVFLGVSMSEIRRRVKEDETAKVFFHFSTDEEGVFKSKALIVKKIDGEVYIDKDSIEKFFETKLDEEELETIAQRSVRIPVGEHFLHPLTEYFNGKTGESLKYEDLKKRNPEEVYFNSWGSASMLVDCILNPESTTDGRATIASNNFEAIVAAYNPLVNTKLLLEGIKNRNLATCMEACNYLQEALDDLMKRSQSSK